MRTGISITLKPVDRRRLKGLTRDRNTPHKHVWRAEIVLLSADGIGTNEIMRRTGKSKTCVWRWQERFMQEGYDGLLRDKTRPPRQREPHFIEEMIRTTESVQTPEIEEALFELAENDAALYANHAWRDVVRRRGTSTSARRYFDLVMEGKIEARDGWHMSREIAGLLSKHSELRDYAYGLLKDGKSPKTPLLANAVAEGDDPDGLLLLVELENKLQRPLISRRTIREAVTEHVPSEHGPGTFDVLPVAVTELRRNLLAMTTDGGPRDSAARVLRAIDWFRDESGAPEGEPRHPDLASGKPWPILVPDPDADTIAT